MRRQQPSLIHRYMSARLHGFMCRKMVIFTCFIICRHFVTHAVYCSLFTHIFCQSFIQRLYSGFPPPKTKFLHMSLSPLSSSVSPWSVIHHLTPSSHLSLALSSVCVLSGSLSRILRGNLFPGIILLCPNHCNHLFLMTSNTYF
jgi:hypothetical protein